MGMQVILNDLKREYPNAYKFLMMNHELRGFIFELCEAKAFRDKDPRKSVVMRNALMELCEHLEETFRKINEAE